LKEEQRQARENASDVEESEEDGLKSEYDSQELDQEGMAQMAKLPSVNDPKLWQVRVKKGSERLAAMALMNKMIDYTQRGKPFAILSATYVENLENFIFVEAYKIDSVRDAIQGLSFCYMKIDILPLNEMTKIYED
jgi:hypothetical protein